MREKDKTKQEQLLSKKLGETANKAESQEE